MAYNTPLWHFVWRVVGLGPIRLIGWSCHALATMCFIPAVLLNLLLQQIPNPYLLGVWRWWLRVNCVENRNLTSAKNLKLATARKPTLSPSIQVVYPCFNQGEWVTPLFYSQYKLDSVVERRANKKYIYIYIWRLQTKNKTKPLRIRLARRADRNNDNNKCRTLVKKLIKLEANDRPKFLEHLKKLLCRILSSTSSATSGE